VQRYRREVPTEPTKKKWYQPLVTLHGAGPPARTRKRARRSGKRELYHAASGDHDHDDDPATTPVPTTTTTTLPPAGGNLMASGTPIAYVTLPAAAAARCFATIKIQVRQKGTWIDLPGVAWSPGYQGCDGVNFETYTATFPAIAGDGIRVWGTMGTDANGNLTSFISCGELEVYGSTSSTTLVPTTTTSSTSTTAKPTTTSTTTARPRLRLGSVRGRRQQPGRRDAVQPGTDLDPRGVHAVTGRAHAPDGFRPTTTSARVEARGGRKR
jgi:hypothetical protein